MSKIPTSRGYIQISGGFLEIEESIFNLIPHFWEFHPVRFTIVLIINVWSFWIFLKSWESVSEAVLNLAQICIIIIGAYILWRIYHIIRGFTFVDTIPIEQIDHVDLINSWRIGGRIVIHYETAGGDKKRKVRIPGRGETDSILQRAEEHFEESGITIQARQGMVEQVRR